MKRPTATRNTFIAMLTGLTLVALGRVSAAEAGSNDSEDKRNGPALTDAAQSSGQRQKSTVSSRLTLLIEAPTGSTRRLVYVPGDGWTFGEAGTDRKPSQAALPVAAARRSGDASAANDSADEPLTMFIDGPTGFTYVWIRDTGWKFVGSIAGQLP